MPRRIPRHTPAGPGSPPEKRKPRRQRKPPVSLSDEQLLALLTRAKEHRQRDYVMILVTYWHGLRASETVALKESDFNLDDGTVQIVRGKGSEGGSHTLQEFPDNPLLNEAVVVADWLANRGQFGVKGGAKPGRVRNLAQQPKWKLKGEILDDRVPGSGTDPAKMQQSTKIVTFSPDGPEKLPPGDVWAWPPGEKPETYHFPPAFEGAPCEKPAGGSEPPPDPSASLLAPSAAPDTPSELLFPISRVQFWRIVHGYALAAGIPRRKCKTHMLKHTIAKHLVRAGHPLNEIQEWMGWSSIETMNWYTRADEEELGTRIGATIRSKGGLRQVQQGSLFS